jgi:hypothetical protein
MDDYKTEGVKINFNQKLDGHVGYSSSPLFFSPISIKYHNTVTEVEQKYMDQGALTVLQT